MGFSPSQLPGHTDAFSANPVTKLGISRPQGWVLGERGLQESSACPSWHLPGDGRQSSREPQPHHAASSASSRRSASGNATQPSRARAAITLSAQHERINGPSQEVCANKSLGVSNNLCIPGQEPFKVSMPTCVSALALLPSAGAGSGCLSRGAAVLPPSPVPAWTAALQTPSRGAPAPAPPHGEGTRVSAPRVVRDAGQRPCGPLQPQHWCQLQGHWPLLQEQGETQSWRRMGG